MDFVSAPALFGLIGASWYAFPEMVACVADHPEKWPGCSARLAVCLVTGATAAAVLVPAMALRFHINEPAYLNALCTGVGLCANKAVPVAQDIIIKALERWARGKAE